MSKSARELALEILLRVEEGAYSNLMLNAALQQNPLGPKDRALLTELVYGTVTHILRLDYAIAQYLKAPMHKVEPWVLQLLRLTFYQLMMLKKIPSYAAVNESVSIAKRKGHLGISRMVNGVLRAYLRNPEKASIPSDLEDVKRISLEHSHPEWLVKRWIKHFGIEITEAICRANNEPHPLSVRINPLKTTREKLLQVFPDSTESQISPQGMRLSAEGSIADIQEFRDGLFTVQDESSMLVGHALSPEPGMRVLDACAAPGGKTTHIAELMENQGEIIANDLHAHKERLIRQQADRLGISIIHTEVGDALTLPKRITGQFDRILIDAPCTGFGVIRRKPDLKWKKSEEDIAVISNLQYQLLSNLAPMLKPGGVMIYSTCTIEPEENENLIQRFLQDHPNFRLDPNLDAVLPYKHIREKITTPGMLQILPQYWGSDGFFIARITRV